MPTRSWRGSASAPAAGDHGRRRGPPLRARGQGRRADPPAGHSGGHQLHGPRPADDTDAPLAGTYLGVAGDPAITELVEGSDGLLLLGVILSDTNFGVNAGKLDLRRTMQALDRQVSMGFHEYRDIPLAALVEALLERARRWATLRRHRRPGLPARARGRRRGHRAGRHRARRQRPVRPARADADRRRRRRLPVHRHGDRPHRPHRPRLLCRHGLRRAGRDRRPARHRPAHADPGRRRRLPDDRLGAGQLPAAAGSIRS